LPTAAACMGAPPAVTTLMAEAAPLKLPFPSSAARPVIADHALGTATAAPTCTVVLYVTRHILAVLCVQTYRCECCGRAGARRVARRQQSSPRSALRRGCCRCGAAARQAGLTVTQHRGQQSILRLCCDCNLGRWPCMVATCGRGRQKTYFSGSGAHPVTLPLCILLCSSGASGWQCSPGAAANIFCSRALAPGSGLGLSLPTIGKLSSVLR
jgi:hypothetical protein